LVHNTVGQLLQETLDKNEISQALLAYRTGLSTKHVNFLVKGRSPISVEVAVLIEDAFPEVKTFPLLLAQLRQEVAGAKAKLRQAKQEKPELFRD
jgi:plasmid maintenance system antidote protein VapI